MKGNDFIFDSVQLMHYKCYAVNFKRGGLYIDPPYWIKKKKAKTKPKNMDDKYFHYAAIVAITYVEIKVDPKRVSNINLHIHFC